VRSSQEAVDSYRKLAALRPEAFLPNLAISLNSLGNGQSALSQPEAALASVEAAFEAIWPSYVRLPAAFEHNTGVILANLRRHFAALGRPPSPNLLQRIETFEVRRSA
jgi:hypothetical protein